MADTSLFSRLQRLFSSDVIIRNVGGKSLKVMDSNRIQKYGNLATNSLYDRFTRLHKPVGSSLQYNPTLNYQSMRLQLYSDYEAMDTDPIIAAALDIISDESTTRNEYGDVLNINSSDENVRKVLQNLFYDVLNVEFNLATWVRNMCKYGDFYLKLEVSEKFGVYNVIPLSTYEVVREEGTDPDNPSYVRFTLDPNGLASGATNTIRRDQFTLENYEVAHFRLLTDSNYLPYGRAYLEPARKVFKQLMLMEDAMLIHRIMRAPEKRVFYINIGNTDPDKVEQFMADTANKMRKTPYIDQSTGDYNLKFNIQNMTEDFFIPIRGNDASTRIDTTKGLDYDGTTDIEYLKAKMMAALKIPKPFLGYEEGVEGKSTLAGMDIRFARTVERIQRIIESELTKIALVHLYSQGFSDEQLVDFKLELTVPSIIYEQEKIELYTAKSQVSQQLTDQKLFSKDWVYENIFGLSPDQYENEKEALAEDAMHKFRLSQIENEGNDPSESGVSYGTPHDLASLYGNKRDKAVGPAQVPTGYDEKDPGRPVEKPQNYGSDKSNFSRDPIGKGGLERDTVEKPSDGNKVSTFEIANMKKSLQKVINKKQILKEEEEEGLLSEKNIKPQE
ncbi:putative portal vertex protein [uncultured virus]|uniref:Putative portal vertex protein n=1 Tax=uncultured virus TaxID=340016 RepID=A0A218MMV1_9VIRU|nr:putative portal vertex protein [uncultured virus]